MDGQLLPEESDLSSTPTDFDSLDRSHQVQAANATYGGGNYGTVATLGGAALGAIPDLVDTVSSSLGLTQRGDLMNKALSAIGSPGLTNFYNENRGAVEVGSGIAAVVAADYAAKAFLEPAGFAMQTLRRVPFAGRIATLAEDYQQSTRALQAADAMAARRGLMGAEQYVGDIPMTSLGRAPQVVNRESLARGVRWGAVKKGLAQNITTEAILLGTANQNSFLFSQDMGENMLWMGAGLGLGAFVDRMAASYAMRKYVNRDMVTRKFAYAYDPTGVETDRLASIQAETDPNASLSSLGYLQGAYTDRATSFMVSARSNANRTLTGMMDLAGRRERLGTQQIGLATDEMQKATSRGINGIPNTGFGLTQPGLGNAVKMRLMDDPASFYGVEAIGAPSGEQTIGGIHDLRQTQLNTRQDYVGKVLTDGGVWRSRLVTDSDTKQKVKKLVLVPLNNDQLEPYRAEFRQLVFQQSLTPQVSMGKEWQPLSIGRLFDGWEEPKLSLETSDERKIWSDPDRGISVGNDGKMTLPGSKQLGDLDLFDSLRLYRAGQAAVDDMAKTKTVLNLPAKPNWFQLDMAENLVKKTSDEGLVQFPPGMTRQSAQVESFTQKAQALSGMKNAMSDPDQMAKLRMQYNLPALSAYESGLLGTSEHPMDVLLRSMTPDVAKNLTYNDILKGIGDVKKINGLTQAAKDSTDSISGEMFNFMRDDSGKPIQPILAYRRPFAPHEWTKEDLADRLAMQKAYLRQGLSQGDDFTAGLSNTLTSDPDYFTSSQVQGLMDSQLQSFLPGFSTAAPQTTRGGILQTITAKEWRDRDSPVLMAAARWRDKGERLTRAMMKERIRGFLGDINNLVNGPRNMQTRQLLNQYMHYRPGWDVLKDPVPITLPNGQQGYQFALDQSSLLNQKRWEKTFGEKMPEQAVLPTTQGKDIVLDELGLDAKTRFNQMSDDIAGLKNSLLKAQGLGEISTVNHYAPPPDVRGKYVGFTLDLDRKPVPGGTLIASTQEEFARLKNALEKDPDSPLNRAGNVFYTQDELKDFADVWDKAQMDFMSPTITALQPGKQATGALTGPRINPHAWEDALTWALDSYLRHGDDVMGALTKEQVNAAETRAQIARVTQRSGDTGNPKGRSIYDSYLENIRGRQSLSSPFSDYGGFAKGAENWINRILAEVSPHVSMTMRNLGDWIDNVIPGQKSKTQDAVFNKLVDDLGPYMPFKSASEMTETNYGAKRPPELAQLTGTMNRFEAAMRLRIGETMQPLIHLSATINALPSVIRHAQPFAGESMEDYAARVGHSTQIFTQPDGKRIGVFDTAKLAANAFKRAWSSRAEPDWQYMMSHGYISQEVAEFQRQFGAIDSQNSWQKFMYGNKINPKNAFEQKGLVGWASILTDRSYDFTRSWGHMAGLELADHLGITDREAQHSFAHDIANKMIGNYDPKNRPEMFQGGLGAPIGLFQTFMRNYYQRLFRYVETGDTRSAAIQYAMQGSIYGATTLPGFSEVNQMFFNHSDGQNDPMDAIYRRFGHSAGDVLFGGVLSNLPKLMNLIPGVDNVPGIALYSRGDARIPMPAVQPPVFVDSAKRIWNALGQAAFMFSKNNPHLSGEEVAETLSNLLTNRPIAGFIEQAGTGGADTNNFGELAAQAQNWMEATYRILGVRSLRQAHELEAFYSNKNAMELQNAKMDDLRLSVRAALRAGEAESIPGYFNRYVIDGGDPRRFTQWVKQNYQSATTSIESRQLNKLSKHPEKWAETQRLLDAEVTVDKTHANPAAYALPQTVGDEMPSGPGLPENLSDPAEPDENLESVTESPAAVSQM